MLAKSLNVQKKGCKKQQNLHMRVNIHVNCDDIFSESGALTQETWNKTLPFLN